MSPTPSTCRVTAILVALLLMGSSVLAFTSLAQSFSSSSAGDYAVYCAAARAAAEGTNPYLTANLHTYHSFAYPPVTLPFFTLLCAFVPYGMQSVQALCLILLLGVSSSILRISLLPSLLLLSLGFGAFEWNVLTGNIGVIGGVCLGIALVAAVRNQSPITAFTLGVLGMIKLIPLIYGAAWLAFEFLTGPRAGRLKRTALYAALVTSPAVLLQLLSIVLYPEYVQTYWASLLGNIPGQHAPIHEQSSNPSHPSLLLFLRAVLDDTGAADVFAYGAYGISVLLLLFSLRMLSNRPRLDQLAALMVVTTLLLPRLKPYSFMAAIVPLLVLYSTHPGGRLRGMLCLLAAVGLPLLAKLHGGGSGLDPVLGFSQWIALVVSYFLAIVPSGSGLTVLLPKPLRAGLKGFVSYSRDRSD